MHTLSLNKYYFSHVHSQYSTLIRKFKDVMEEYNNVQEKYREKNKERIQKQLQYGELANSYVARKIVVSFLMDHK